ncbi:MAG: hypothetical protein UT09_C0041G0003 [Parcubacteria group bacterium GW2011_GWF2_38_8]|nr:MAG: hypothetical protein UT09_C0041G0003 [Parcubacteria group bacterium GW2011_GWF2_38_8]
MNTKLEIIFLISLGLIALISVIWMIRTEKRLKKIFAGKKAKDLEEVIAMMEDNISKLKWAEEKIGKEVVEINKKLRKSIRGLETIRFNPFADQGSNQSFAIGMLNEDRDGVVLSSLYSRERMSMFAKPIKNGKSEYELTTEEKEVLEKAKV